MQNACMPSITIRDVPDETRNELAARAASSGRSLQEYLLQQLIELARRPDPEVLVIRARARKLGVGATDLDVAEILRQRDADRR